MLYLSDQLRSEWLPEDGKFILQGQGLNVFMASDREQIVKDLATCHSLIHGKDAYVEWILQVMDVGAKITHASQHPFGFQLQRGDALLVARWSGRAIKWDEDFHNQINGKSFAFVEFQRYELK